MARLAPVAEITELLTRYVDAVERGVVRRGPGYWCGSLDGLSGTVRNSLLKVERHKFLEGFYRWDQTKGYVFVPVRPDAPDHATLNRIYEAVATGLVIKVSARGTPISSQSSPFLMVIMLELLGLKPGMRVLEIGTGTGYNAALIAEIVGSQELVTTVEIQPDLVRRTKRLLRRAGYSGIQVRNADGFYGWPQKAPYDRIVVTTCCADISHHWLKQLAHDGWALVPLRHGGELMAPLCKVHSSGRGRGLEPAGFAPAQGELAGHVPWVSAAAEESHRASPLHRGHKILRLLEPSPAELNAFASQFHYFVALNEPNTSFFRLPDRVVLIQEDASREEAGLTLEGEWVRVVGTRRLCGRLEDIYAQYERLGLPRVEDYQMDFSHRSVPLDADEGAPRIRQTRPREWTIERRFTTQRVWLST